MNARLLATDPAEPYYELARYELAQKFTSDEAGDLSDAFDGELYDALRTLGATCANGARSTDDVMLAVGEFRTSVERAALAYAERRVAVRALEMAEDDE